MAHLSSAASTVLQSILQHQQRSCYRTRIQNFYRPCRGGSAIGRVRLYACFHCIFWTRWPLASIFCLCVGHDTVIGHSLHEYLLLRPISSLRVLGDGQSIGANTAGKLDGPQVTWDGTDPFSPPPIHLFPVSRYCSTHVSLQFPSTFPFSSCVISNIWNWSDAKFKSTPCPKNVHLFIFLNNSVSELTDFNNFCYAKSWENLTRTPYKFVYLTCQM